MNTFLIFFLASIWCVLAFFIPFLVLKDWIKNKIKERKLKSLSKLDPYGEEVWD